MKKTLPIFVILLTFAATLGVALAISLSSYLIITPSGSSNESLMAGSGNYTEQSANRYTPSGGDLLCSIKMSMDKVGTPTGNFSVGIWRVTGSSSNPTSGTTELRTENLDVSTLGTSFATSTFDFTEGGTQDCLTLVPTSDYYIRLTTSVALSNPATNYVQYRAESSANQYSNISRYDLGHNTGWGSSTNEVAMELYGATVPQMAITFPANDSINAVGRNFPYFQITGNFPQGSNVIFVDYATSTSNLNSTSTLVGSDSYTLPDSSGPLFDDSESVFRRTALSAGVYYSARARLFTGVLQVATSSDITFLTGADSSSFTAVNYYPTSTLPNSTSTSLSLTCDSSAGAFQYSFCFLFQSLFVPNQAALNNFSQLKTDLQNKPPFGYITSLGAAFSNFTTSTTSTLDLSALSGLSTAFDPIRALMTWGLWLLYGFWLFNRFRHFQF